MPASANLASFRLPWSVYSRPSKAEANPARPDAAVTLGLGRRHLSVATDEARTVEQMIDVAIVAERCLLSVFGNRSKAVNAAAFFCGIVVASECPDNIERIIDVLRADAPPMEGGAFLPGAQGSA